MKELAVSAIGATGNFGRSDDICSFLSEFSHTPSLSTAHRNSFPSGRTLALYLGDWLDLFPFFSFCYAQ